MQAVDITHFVESAHFRAWLEKHHASADALWVGYYRKASGRPSVTWEETVDEALCFGWIDGIRKRIDDESYTIRFTPRRPRSVWSRRNIERYEVLLKAGLIEASGEAAWSRRKEDRSGVYSFEQEATPELPAAYRQRLSENPEAFAFWEASPPGYRRQAAHWVMSAKREETRERRLRALVEDSSAGLRVKPLRRRV